MKTSTTRFPGIYRRRKHRRHGWAALGRPLLPALAILCMLLAGTLPVSGQAVVVRSGEHLDFTRLVMTLPAGASWDLTETPQGYALALDTPGAEFDISAVFDRIPRDRISSISATTDPARLMLSVPCDCNAIAFVEPSELLVIDIRDTADSSTMPAAPSPLRNPPAAAAPANPEAEAPDPISSPASPPVSVPLSVPVSSPVSGSLPAADAAARRAGYDWRAQLLDGVAGRTAPLPTALETGDALASDMTDTARDLLVSQLARAAAQGLVQVAGQDRAENAATDNHGITPPGGADTRPKDPVTALTQHLALGAETAVDQALRRAQEAVEAAAVHACPPLSYYSVPDWGSSAPASYQLATTRGQLVGEFDAVRPHAVIALTELYIFFGFGAEAGEVLETFAGDEPQRAALRLIAALIDDAAPPPDLQVAALAACNGPAALWGVLAAAPDSVPQELNADSVVQAFAALPAHLRQHLGPRLIERLLAAGRRDAALSVRNIFNRAPGGLPEHAALIDAMLKLDRNQPEAALRILNTIAVSNSPEAPVAVERMLRTMVAQNIPPDTALLENLETLAYQHRGSDLGTRLAQLSILGLATAGQFDAAFKAFDASLETGTSDGGVLESEQVAQLFGLLARDATDSAFLRHLLTRAPWLEGRLPAPERREIAGRAIDLGFPDLAQKVLSAITASDAPEILLHARAALQQADPQKTLALLAGLPGEEVARLRAQALLRLNAPQAALQAFSNAADTEHLDAELRHAAWLAGDANAITRHGSEIQRASIAPSAPDGADDRRVASSPSPGTTSGLPHPTDETAQDTGRPASLAEATRMLEESRAVRNVLGELLEAHSIPVDSDDEP